MEHNFGWILFLLVWAPVIVILKDKVFSVNSQKVGEKDHDFTILKFEKDYKILSFPILLIGTLILTYWLYKVFFDNLSVNTESLITLCLLTTGFIFLPFWYFFHYKNYRLKYNDEKIVLERFIFGTKTIYLSDIKKSTYFKNERVLYVNYGASFIRVSAILTGFGEFIKHINNKVSVTHYDVYVASHVSR